MDQAPPIWMPFAAFGWIAVVVGISIIYRRRAGKPIYPKLPPDVLYAERWASGPFASNCLMVAVTSASVSVVPKFPFNLMFLAEIYGLERSIPIESISAVQRTRSILGNNVAVTYGVDRKTLRLRLNKPDQFLNALRKLVSPTATLNGS
ncbi:hypothetical protein H7F51_08480 [Novosphingobium flavum]|uniref:PH domain-containing protein n=1 Tax=Novosphingobium flavum TaxID=1778672 RepID=A0A7X1FSJ8_9SPHN|nr:hypothetical protein [Novosphingobium flavum]MBC2665557.1 hypothetical protein [Novosphingobium flavum]